jgi:hypothetical protein
MVRRAATTLWSIVIGALIGAYMAAVNCPIGWWSHADVQAGTHRVIGGVLVGALIGWLVGLGIAGRRERAG